MKPSKLTFGERLKFLRELRNIDQATLAKHLGISTASVSYYENGKNLPFSNNLIAIADYFDVTLDFLVGRPSRGT